MNKIIIPASKQPLPPTAKKIFSGVVFDVYQWEVKTSDGQTKIFEKVKRPDTVQIIAITADKKIIIINETQPGKKSTIGLAGGRVDEGEDVLTAAKRELLEETGYTSDNWQLFDSNQPVSKVEWAIYTLLAKDCHKITEQHLDGTEKIDLLIITFEEFINYVLAGKLEDKSLMIQIMKASQDSAKLKALRTLFFGI